MTKRFGFEAGTADDPEGDKILEDIAKGTPPGPPASPPALETPPATPPVQSPPVEKPENVPPVDPRDGVIIALQDALTEAKHDASQALGRLRVQAVENKELKDTNKKLSDRIAELEKAPPVTIAPAADTTRPTRVKALQDDFGLDEASATRFEKMNQEAIDSGIKSALLAMGIKPGDKPAAPVAEPAAPPKADDAPPLDETRTYLSPTSWRVFNSLVPDFASIANVDDKGVAQFSPELRTFFGQIDPKTRTTYGKMAQDAVADDDPVRLAAIYNEFKAVMARQGRPLRPLAPNTGPGGGGGPAQPKPTYSRQEADAFMKEYQKNIGNYSPEQLAAATAKLDEYENAALEGRLT